MYESNKPGPKTSKTVEYLIQPQVHSHAECRNERRRDWHFTE